VGDHPEAKSPAIRLFKLIVIAEVFSKTSLPRAELTVRPPMSMLVGGEDAVVHDSKRA